MNTIENQIRAIIAHFGAEQFNAAVNNLSVEDLRENANLRITDYMAMDGELIGTHKRLVKNVIITSPTQLGKTRYVIDACKKNENKGELIVISCDNSNVQSAQLRARLMEAGVRNYPVTKASSGVVGRILKDGKTVVIVMLNNASQVGKLDKLISELRYVNDPTRYIFFHDEADMLNKSDSVLDLANGKVPLSHRSWVGLMDILEKSCIPTNRFWISATPENCSSISRILGIDIMVLPDNSNYRPVSGFTSWSPDDENADDALCGEIERIREIGVEFAGEVILYCVDRKNEEQDEMAREISEKYNCVTCSYNMKNMLLYFDGSIVTRVIGNKDDIATVLDKTRELCISENAPMVVVGYNLLSRGVSFVANGYNPPTATVMFYSGGVSSHVVGLAQRFGRITGTSRPEITRRMVYCLPGVYSDYSGYIANQKLVWDALSSGENSELDICSILMKCGNAVKINRPLDRPTLGTVNAAFGRVGSVSSDSSDSSDSEWDEDKMQRLVDSWRVDGNNTAIARLFREMLGSDGNKMESVMVKRYFENPGAIKQLTTSHRHHNLVFRKQGRYHYIRQEVLSYLGL